MSLFQLSQIINSAENSREFLMQRGVIYDSRRCPDRNCRRQMVLESADHLTGFIWRCRGPHRKTESLLNRSYFENSNLSCPQMAALIYMWSHDCTNEQIKEFIDISNPTVIDQANVLRELCSWKLLQQPIVLGGPGVIVQLDESVIAKRKYEVGRYVPPRWIFGAYDSETKLGVIRLVPDRSAPTLLPIIVDIVAPGSIIHTDCWRAYAQVAQLGFQHGTVNHSIEFVSPTGVHTQGVERYWGSVKQKIKRICGSNEFLLPSYLDEFMWRERYGKTHTEAFDNILTLLSE